jgi:hypothetical protein
LLDTEPCEKQPHFGSALVIELRQNSNGNYFIQIFLKNNDRHEAIGLKMLKIKGIKNKKEFINFFILFKKNLIERLYYYVST